MTACSFCGKNIEVGTGKMYVRRDATVYHFCCSKCQRNQVDLGRVNRHVKWTAAAAAAKAELKATVKATTPKAAKPKAAKAE